VSIQLEVSTIAAAVLIVLGLLLRGWAIYELAAAGITGQSFELVQMQQRYVATGPYRFLSHPAYVGSLMFLAGLGMLFLGWGGLAVCAPAWPFYAERITIETILRQNYEKQRAAAEKQAAEVAALVERAAAQAASQPPSATLN